MRNKLGYFVSGIEYNHGMKTEVSATMRFNRWLETHANIEVISWQTTSIGESNQLCIVVEYKEV
jgi:hypothetical protein